MQPLMPRMSPAEEQRELKARLRREGMLQAVVAACLALIDLVETGVITKDSANRSPKMIQQKFHNNEDRAIQQGAVGEVLSQVNITPGSKYFVPTWRIVEAKDALTELAPNLRDERRIIFIGDRRLHAQYLILNSTTCHATGPDRAEHCTQ